MSRMTQQLCTLKTKCGPSDQTKSGTALRNDAYHLYKAATKKFKVIPKKSKIRKLKHAIKHIETEEDFNFFLHLLYNEAYSIKTV